MSDRWFILRNGKQHGPFVGHQLKQLANSGKLKATDLVLQEGAAKPVAATVEHGIVIFFDRGATTFIRMAKIPFPPYIGLTLNSDAAGSYDLERVGWLDKFQMFITQGSVIRRDWTLAQAIRRFQKDGWTQEKSPDSVSNSPTKEPKGRRRSRKSTSPPDQTVR